MVATADEQIPVLDALGTPHGKILLAAEQGRFDRADDAGGNAVLQFENLGEWAVLVPGPGHLVAVAVDQFDTNTDVSAHPADLAADKVADGQVSARPCSRGVLGIISERRLARRDAQQARPGQADDDVLGHAFGEIGLVLIAWRMAKGQDRNARALKTVGGLERDRRGELEGRRICLWRVATFEHRPQRAEQRAELGRILVAIPVDGESYGKSKAVLEYTLATTAFATDAK